MKIKKITTIIIERCSECPNIRNENPRLYCYTCAMSDNKVISGNNGDVFIKIPDWCPLETYEGEQ